MEAYAAGGPHFFFAVDAADCIFSQDGLVADVGGKTGWRRETPAKSDERFTAVGSLHRNFVYSFGDLQDNIADVLLG